MRKKTYAYNSIIIGFLIGLLVGVSTESAVLAILAGLGVAVVGFIIIRFLENALDKGVDKAAQKVSDAYRQHKAKNAETAAGAAAAATQFPASGAKTQFPGAAPAQANPQPAAENTESEFKFCPYCGAQVKRSSKFCPACGKSLSV